MRDSDVGIVESRAQVVITGDAGVERSGVSEEVRQVLVEVVPGDAAEQALPVGDLAVEFGRDVVADGLGSQLRKVIVRNAGRRWRRIVGKNLHRRPLEASGLNGV